MKTKFIAIFGLLLFGLVFKISAQSVIGKWNTIDDKTHEKKSVVEIYKGSDGLYYGKVVSLYRKPNEDQNPLCTECRGNMKNKPIKGMIVITKMKKINKNLWDDGEILDPDSGTKYDCKMWIENGKLQVRGYLGWSLFGRSQTWLPYK